jgi:predicted Holliday junction resolvase-like endonuclease
MKTEIRIGIGVIIWCLIGYLLAKIFFLIKIKGHRQNAVQRSRSVVLGNVHEKIAPLLPNFPYHYKDLVFLGKWIDYLVFDGLSEWNLREIVFLEIKSWVSQLNKNETMIKNCIQDKRMSYKIRRNQ